MDAASLQFVLFGLAVALLSNLRRTAAWRSAVLLLASMVFLALVARSPIALLPLLGFLMLGYALLVLRERRICSCVLSVVIFIVAYLWLERYSFLPRDSFLPFPYFTLGLSYVFFRVLQLLIEAGDGNVDKRQHIGLGAYLLYTLNFTTLVSGPIQRYEEFARDQFAAEPMPLGARTVGLQVERMAVGFFKVNVLAMLLHLVHVNAVSQMSQPLPPALKFSAAFRLAIVYPLFLYANFSGYIDIVIALARLMGVRLPENFDRPFSASSFIEFWNRWHMTLSGWLKAYVYNPLLIALMRSRASSPGLEPLLGIVSLFVTFFLIGIWHGRTSEFFFYGLATGAGVAINKLWQLGMTRSLGRKGYQALASNSIYIAFGRGMTFSWFAFTLFWFWSDWKQIAGVFTALGPVRWLAVWIAVCLGATVVLALWEWLRGALLSMKSGNEPILLNRYVRVVYATALGLAAFMITVLLNQPAPDIVYKAF